jgi:hypothetical protein
MNRQQTKPVRTETTRPDQMTKTISDEMEEPNDHPQTNKQVAR